MSGTNFQSLLGDTSWDGDAINVDTLSASNLTVNKTLSIPSGAVVDSILTCIDANGTSQWKSTANLTGLTTQTFQQPPGAAVGKVMTSDINGIGNWEYVPDPVITLAGDVTGLSNADVVEFVGGSSAANIHSAELLANAATSNLVSDAIVRRDSIGNFIAGNITGGFIGTHWGNNW